jgi:YHS domain-containing protein
MEMIMNEIEEEARSAETACGGKLKDASGYPSAEYQGRKVYFCSQACLNAFLGDPDRFMAGEVEHPE